MVVSYRFMSAGFPCTAIALMLSVAQPAQAQVQSVPDAEEMPARQATIVVTAQRREQALVDVPIAVSVLNAALLEKARGTSLEDIQQIVPNFSLEKRNGYNNIAIRGVGGGGRNIGFETRAGVYIDGAYIGQPQALGVPLFGIEQVEILRGPQGYLFGRNSVSGAVNIVTAAPTTDPEGFVRIVAGGYETFEGYAGWSGPVAGERILARVGAAHERRGGFSDNLLTGDDLDDLERTSFRGRVRVKLSDAAILDLSADYADILQNTVVTGERQTDFFDTVIPGIPLPPRQVEINTKPFEDVVLGGVSARLGYEPSEGPALVSVTTIRGLEQRRVNDSDYSAADLLSVTYDEIFSQLSQEIRIVSPDERRLRYVAGIYLLNDLAKTRRDATVGQDLSVPVPFPNGAVLPYAAFGLAAGSVTPIDGKIETQSAAAFISVDYDLTDRVRVGVGARYTDEKKSVRFNLDGSRSGGFRIGSVFGFEDRRKDSAFTPALNVTYALSGDINAYARYASGFKSGGWNLDFLNRSQAAADFSFDEETVESYELGLKGSLLDQGLQFELALFRSEFEDFQIFQTVRLPSGVNIQQLNNAASVVSEGIEFSAAAAVSEGLRVTVNGGLTDAVFSDFPDGGGEGVDLDGNALPNAPDFNGSIAFDYELEVPGLRGMFAFYGEASRRSRSYVQPGNLDQDLLEARNLVNGRISFIPDKGNWELSVWGRNLLDDTFAIRRGRDFLGNQWTKYNDPRVIGAELRYDF